MLVEHFFGSKSQDFSWNGFLFDRASLSRALQAPLRVPTCSTSLGMPIYDLVWVFFLGIQLVGPGSTTTMARDPSFLTMAIPKYTSLWWSMIVVSYIYIHSETTLNWTTIPRFCVVWFGVYIPGFTCSCDPKFCVDLLAYYSKLVSNEHWLNIWSRLLKTNFLERMKYCMYAGFMYVGQSQPI